MVLLHWILIARELAFPDWVVNFSFARVVAPSPTWRRSGSWWRTKKAKDCKHDVVDVQRCVRVCLISFSPVPAATHPAHPPSARRHAQSHQQGNQVPSAIPTHSLPSLDARWSGPTGRCLPGGTETGAQSVNDVMHKGGKTGTRPS